MLLLLCGSYQARAQAAEPFVFHHENVMGTSLELRLKADDEAAARQAETRVLEEIDRLSAILSGYDKTSELSRWQGAMNVATKVSPELYEVLERSEYWMAKGKGSFDPRVQALTSLWTGSARQKRRPTAGELADVRTLMAANPWSLDPIAKTATHLSTCPLSFNGIAKGYIVERASRLAFDESRGIRGLLLNVGGDLRVMGSMNGSIGIASPQKDSETTGPIASLAVENHGIATSGNYQRGLKIGDQWYSHIFDPRDGQPVRRVVSATIIAPRLDDADALAKVVSVLPMGESLEIVKTLPGVECLLVSEDGSVARSPGFRRFERTKVITTAFADEKAKPAEDGKKKAEAKPPWAPEFEFVVNFEISPPKGNTTRYRRPYVAIWVEDEDKLSVRTLTLWVQADPPGPRWIPDLKHWYQSDQVRRLVETSDLVETISRATRPAGKYRVIWDGKDDRGEALPKGTYTLAIEVAREHGTHQIIRKEIKLDDQTFAEELKGNVEIKSASIEYRRKAAAK
ncbi:DUF2271 domain-containing protein [Singulisphaera sp. PoT]|uniref:DUF2271 domain-containing protein n=1 Tax=Singulisphaera sp. PoT TaxID=3411797 RepID=UPI003BF4A255